MPRLILLLAIAAVLYIMFRRVQTVPPHRRRAEYIKLGLAVAAAVVVVLAVTGRMHWIGIAAAGVLVVLRQLLPTLVRLFPLLAAQRAQGATGAAGGAQTSTVETPLLRMQLAHDSGDLQGEVLKGSYQGWRLADMDRRQLEELMDWCRSQDEESTRLLDSYLQQRFPGEGPFGRPRGTTGGSQDMNRQEALAILGLAEDASREDIVTAHRSLIQKLHPDRGGNDYLAAKINQAKDFLLG
ncbi:MAG: molecular chaperone DnaJ [Pseudomonadales bacterium]|nr:molecular chaperone DnaJ [Pseudomonadales bacterium]